MQQVSMAIALLCLTSATSSAQFFPTNEAEADSIYQINIRKTRINGVYIPKTLEEALAELQALSDQPALTKIAVGDEEDVARGLHFGLGRWIRYNWNLEQGSRIGHLLRTKYSIYHPEDQSDALIRILHRELNNKDWDLKALQEGYEKKWNTERLKRVEQGEHLGTLRTEKKERPDK